MYNWAEFWKVSLHPARPLGCTVLMTFIAKPSWRSVCLSKQPNLSPQSFYGRFVNLKMCYRKAWLLPSPYQTLKPAGIHGFQMVVHILLPQNNNHPVKWKPWPALQIWIAIQSVSIFGCLDGHGSKCNFFGWPQLGSSGKSGSFMLPLVFHFTFAWGGNTCFEKGGRC